MSETQIEIERNDTKLPTRKVAQRYAVTPRSIERWEANEKLAFPKAIKINNRKYWSVRDLEQWERHLPTLKAEKVPA
jgi:hypothetical protein